MWDESKHPRARDGKFTDGYDNNGREKKKEAVKRYSDDPKRDLKNAEVGNPQNIIAYGFNRLKTGHHEGHAKEMGYKNIGEYHKAAIEFCTQGEGIVYRGERRGDVAKYNERTGEYAIVKNGKIKSYYTINKKKFEKIKRQEHYHE